jgi:hypothetical protein
VKPPPPPLGWVSFIIFFFTMLALFGLMARVVEPGPVPTAAVLTLGVASLAYMAYRRWTG